MFPTSGRHARLTRRAPRLTAGCLLAGWLMATAACGSNPPSGSPTPVGGSSSPPVISVKLSDAGCDPYSFALPAGTVVFSVTNSGSQKVKEMEVTDQQGHVRGDVEGVEPGKTRSFVVDLSPGTYLVHCPQDSVTHGTVTVN